MVQHSVTKDPTAPGGMKEEVTVIVNLTKDEKTLIFPHDKLTKRTKLVGSKGKALNLLNSVKKQTKIWSTCESIRTISAIGTVNKEIIMNDNTEILLIDKENKPYGLAIKKADGLAFDFFALESDYGDILKAVYKKLNDYSPADCGSCRRETIDFRGLGTSIK